MQPTILCFSDSRSPARAAQRGVAIVLVLLFIVLLVGLIVAFFSRAMIERQISNSSANTSKVDIFAQGTVDQIVGDLQDEIFEGSVGTAAGSGTIYTPNTSANAMPVLVGSSGTGGLENLVKISLGGSDFYSGRGFAVSGTARAVAVSSTVPSVNGRYISLDRWNKPLFLPVASSTDITPVTTATFTAPDWVLVSRDGSNPTSWSPGLKSSRTGSSTVIGRYAYAIYHEGGLLDANAVGYPYNSAQVILGGLPVASGTVYKNSEALVDLYLLEDSISGANCLSRKNVGTLVGWRNWSTLAATGSATGIKFSNTSISGSNYYAYAVSNTTGFLAVSGTLNSGQSDRMFVSRQQLIDFVKNVLGCTSTAQGSNINVLNYLTTFSRDINQPSFVPGAGRPGVMAVASGGNDVGNAIEDNLTTPTTFSNATVNPAFLAARVTTAGTRNDGTALNIGEPLVKKRFALKRLAWLTYKGPSANRTIPASNPGISSPDYDMWLLVNKYGISSSFLAEGSDDNIKKYFGLAWVTDNGSSIGIGDGTSKWKYVHGTLVSGANTAGESTPAGSIMTLGKVAAAGREPDFFELLKAAVSVGAIAKPATPSGVAISTSAANPATPAGYQNKRDSSVDASIIQLGANIIDQFDADSYSTRIIFDDNVTFPGYPQEYRGIEDLPYFYRVRGVHIKTADSTPATSATSVITGTYTLGASASGSGVIQITNAGSGVYILVPEIWNPHNFATGTAASGISPLNGQTGEFKMWALSCDPQSLTLQNTASILVSTNNGVSISGSGSGFLLDTNSPHLSFTIPSTRLDFFRESTLLNKPDSSDGQPGPPKGCGLVSSGSTITSYYKAIAYQAASYYDNQKYIGFPLVASGTSYPLWIPASSGTTCAEITAINFGGNTNLTYRLQYQDPNNTGKWVTYDEKFLPIPYTWALNDYEDYFLWGAANTTVEIPPYRNGVQTNQLQLLGEDNYVMITDPRTSRFSGNVYSAEKSAYCFVPPPYLYNGSAQFGGWVDCYSNALVAARPDYQNGWPVLNPGSNTANTSASASGTMGFYGGYSSNASVSWNWTSGVAAGMFSQNSKNLSMGSSLLMSGAAQGFNSNPYYTDPDGVVRRASGGYSSAPDSPVNTGTGASYTNYNGLPMQTATIYTSGSGASSSYSSRPVILNRPFNSVADLGYVFSGTPWRNIDFSMPESGYAALLDVFCINDTDDPDGLVAGKVNLNTRQAPVLETILTSAYKNELNLSQTLSASEASAMITDGSYGLLARTNLSAASPKGPLTNISELVGKWIPGSSTTAPMDGSAAYDGFSADLNNISATASSTPPMNILPRFHESTIRALANIGQTRVWNLMIDVVAQTGRYSQSASSLEQFLVEGEQRYWVHVAIDRATGKIIDKQIEVVKE